MSLDTERLRNALSEQAAPDAHEAEERAWRVVQAAFAEATPRSPRRRWRRTAVIALSAGLVAVAIGPAGADVRDWVGDALETGTEPAQPALTELPEAGRLLVDSPKGPWIVQQDGSKRLLGDYEQSSWSPNGLFVVAASSRELVAVDPRGEVRWSLAREGLIRLPRWSPDGFRIAYFSGPSLRIVAGDGTGDRLLRSRVARTVPPAWRPGLAHVLAFSRADGSVQVADADTGRPILRTAPVQPLQLIWSADGSRLVVLTEAELRTYSERGELLGTQRLPFPARAAASSATGELAVIVRSSSPPKSTLLLIDPSGRRRQLFAGPGEFTEVAWSPGGDYLLLAWRSADQWLFLDPDRPQRTVAVSNISSQFSPGESTAGFPAISGWCCAP